MGTCHEFGPSIQDGCGAPMVASRTDACTCPECGVVCHGRFPGCATVWARGPQAVHWRTPEELSAPVPEAVTDAAVDDAVAPDLQRLVSEVMQLRIDLENHRVAYTELAQSQAVAARAAVAAELERLLQAEPQPSGVLRRLAGAIQPTAAVDVGALVSRLTAELVPAITARVLAEQRAPHADPPWQDRTA